MGKRHFTGKHLANAVFKDLLLQCLQRPEDLQTAGAAKTFRERRSAFPVRFFHLQEGINDEDAEWLLMQPRILNDRAQKEQVESGIYAFHISQATLHCHTKMFVFQKQRKLRVHLYGTAYAENPPHHDGVNF